MVRAKLWFRCAAMHDPVTPVIDQPAFIGWEAKGRKVDLKIERAFSGEELLRRMKGWITLDPTEVITAVNRFGRLKVLDDRNLVVECETLEAFEDLRKHLKDAFGQEIDVEIMGKQQG